MTPPSRPLGIFAGSGRLPRYLGDAATRANRAVTVLRLHGETDEPFDDFDAHEVRFGEFGRITKLLAAAGVSEIVFAGGVHRPSIGSIRPDWGGLQLMPKLPRLLMGGDDALLRKVADLLAEYGLTLISPLQIAPELSAEPGLIAGSLPTPTDEAEISVGASTARGLGDVDAGQSVIVERGRAIALEGIEGTDAMITRAGALRASGRWRTGERSGVLVKTAKPSQDMRLDVPTIGPDTVRAAASAGLLGIAVEAGRVMILERPEVETLAREHALFLWGIP